VSAQDHDVYLFLVASLKGAIGIPGGRQPVKQPNGEFTGVAPQAKS
jgi:hypothetical protein